MGSFVVGGEPAAGEGMFGSAAWTGTGTGTRGGVRSERNRGGHEFLGCLGAGGRRVGRNSIQGRHSVTAHSEESSPRKHRELRGRDGERFTPFDDEDDEDHIAEAENKYLQQAEGGLVGGLKPLRDRYLTGSLSRMTGPVLQMFPEMEGYTGMYKSIFMLMLMFMLTLIFMLMHEFMSIFMHMLASVFLLLLCLRFAVKSDLICCYFNPYIAVLILNIYPLISYLLPLCSLNCCYLAAVPSKRDMQTLIRSVQTELGMAAAEGDMQGGLLRAVCKEAVKAVQLVSLLRYRLLCICVCMCVSVLECVK